MKEYIDREKLIAEYDRVHVGSAGGARKLMVDAPTADVVEVVRCKDCKYWGGATYGYICSAWSGINTKNYTRPDGFCSYGERKEQG